MFQVIREDSQWVLIVRYVHDVFPLVKKELNLWRSWAEKATDSVLLAQAFDSLQRKAFHCLGGSIYALYPGVDRERMISFIVAYQTISDYLDNLVDAAQVQDERAFAQLHLAMTEALDPEAELSDYYAAYPWREDGGYLEQLVRTCQAYVRCLPSFFAIKKELARLASWYSSLQTYKHLRLEEREAKMRAWLEPKQAAYPDVSLWELAAATGSTLGIFCLVAAAQRPGLAAEEVLRLEQAYFPWICGLHILLDYFIDSVEDRETDQLNFVQYYSADAERDRRLVRFWQESQKRALSCAFPSFHQTVVRGLLAMYLSDLKTGQEEMKSGTRALLDAGGRPTRLLYRICRLLRKQQIL